MPASKFRDDITVIGVPLTAICNREYTDPRQRQLFKNIIYVGALSALLDMDVGGDREADRRAVQGQGEADRRQHACAASRPRLGADESRVPDRAAACARQRGRRPHLHRGQFSAAALGAVYGGATVCAWYPITPSSSLADAFTEPLPRGCASIPTPRRATSPSCRPRTSSPRSAW